MLSKYIKILLLLLISTNLYAADYFWVGGTGNWSDFANHWATASGGATFYSNSPTISDNVYFDNNSQATNDTIFIDITAICNDLTLSGNVILQQDFQLSVNGVYNLNSGKHFSNSQNLVLNAFTSTNTLNFRYFDISNSTVSLTGQDTVWDIKETFFTFTQTATTQIQFSFTGNNSVIFKSGGSGILYQNLVSNVQNLVFYDNTSTNNLTINTNSKLILPSTTAINSQLILTCNTSLNVLGNCSSPAYIEGDNTNSFYNQAIIDLNFTGATNVNYTRLQNLTGINGTFTALNSIDLGNNTNWVITEDPSNTTVFWINGGGNWSDATHWSSGCIPGPNNNVVFDNSSGFLAGDAVNVDIDAYCANMTWTGVNNTPDLSGIYNNIYIKGSLQFDPNMTATFNQIYNFTSQLTGNTITLNGLLINGNFDFTHSGTWDFLDDYNSIAHLKIDSGNVNLINKMVNIDAFITNTTPIRNVDISNSIISLIGVDSTWIISPTNLNLTTTGSSIWVNHTLNGTSIIKGGGITYNNFKFSNISSRLFDNNTFSILEIDPNSSLAIESGSTQNMDSLIANGTCANVITIESTDNFGTAANINKTGYDTLIITSTNLLNVTANNLGPKYNLAQNSITLFNTTGWDTTSIASGTGFYWIGGSGNWNDLTHWVDALNLPKTCLPTINDTVYFNASSFAISGDSIVVNIDGYFAKMDWTGSGSFNPKLHLIKNLHCRDSILFNPSLIVENSNPTAQIRFVPNGNNCDFNTFSRPINANLLLKSQNLTDTLHLNGALFLDTLNQIEISIGTFNTNSDSITTGDFLSTGSGTREILLNNSYIEVYQNLDFTSLTNLNAGTSTISAINTLQNSNFYGNGLIFNNVIFENTLPNSVTNLFNSNSYNDLTFVKGLLIRIQNGSSHTINGNFIAKGTCVDSIFIQSQITGSGVTFNLAVLDSAECISVSDLNVASSNLTAFFSTDNGNNTGTTFSPAPHSTPSFTTTYDQCLGNATTFTNTSNSFTGGLTNLTYEWDFGDGTTDNSTNPTHVYSSANEFYVNLTTIYSNLCENTYLDSVRINNPQGQLFTSELDTSICDTYTVNFNALSSPSADLYNFYINGVSVQNSTGQTFTSTTLANNDSIALTVTLNGCTTISPNYYIYTVTPLPNVTLTSSDGDNVICDGDSITYTASGADEYQFFIDGIAQTLYTTSNSFTTSSLINGQTVSVVGKDTIPNCEKNGNVNYTMTVNPNPTPFMANSDADNVICDGDIVTFTGSNATNYEFFVNGNSVQGPTTIATFTSTTLNNNDVVTIIGTYLGCSSLSTDSYTFLVNPIPNVTLTNATGSTTICESDLVDFTANGATTYEFWVGGITVQGPSGLPTYSSPSITNGQNVYVVGSTNNCFDTSTVQTFTVNPLPIPMLTSTDADTVICQYENVTFTASGASTYQFLLDGFPISPLSATSIYNTDSLNNGQSVGLIGEQNGCFNTSTNLFTFTVKPSFNVNLFSSDGDLTICEGESIDFTGVAGTGTINYDIYVNNTLQNSNTNGSFTLTGLSAGTQQISLSATKNGCTYFANDTLAVLVKPIPVVTLTSSDLDNVICNGDSVLFIASGATTYEFLIDGVSQGVSTQDSLYLTSLTNGQVVSVNGYTNGCFDVSNSFTFVVNPIPLVLLSSDDIDNIICEGTAITFTATGATTYELFIDGVSLAPPSTTSFFTNSTFSVNTLIEVVGESNNCFSNGNSINLIVNPNPIISTTISDSDTTICDGDLVTISGTGASTYQLIINGVPTASPSTQNNYTTTLLNNDVVSLQGYSVNGCFSTSTNVFTFSVTPNPTVTMVSSDIDSVICINDIVTFNASGASTYIFYVDGQIAFNGANYSTDSIQNGQIISVTGEQNGCYSDANPIPFTVYLYPITSLITTDNDTTVCIGDSIIFVGLGAFDYEFFVNGISVQGPSNSDTLYSTSLANNDIITVNGINNGCGTLSNQIPVNVITYPTTSLTSSDADNTICYGESVVFTSNGASNYEFFINSISQGGISSSNSLISTTLNDLDSVWVVGYNGECPTNEPQSFIFTVNTLPLTLTSSGNNLICSGDPISYTSSGADSYEFFIDGVSAQGPSTNATFTSSAITNGQTITVNGFSTTTGCTQLAQTSHIITVMNIPVITSLNSTTICEEDSSVLVSSSPTWNQWFYNSNAIFNAIDTSYVAYQTGDYFTEISLGGNGNVLALGNNAYGQFGDSTTISDNYKVDTKNLQNIVNIESGQNHNLALDANGIVYAWGKNDYGQIGDGTFTSQIIPYTTNISNATSISAGHQFSLTVLTTGEVMSWGKNDFGQLGQGNNSTTNFPFIVAGLTNVVNVVGGQNHSLALLNDGTVMSWGDNQFGQLGIGSFVNQNTPQLIPNLSGIASIQCGANHSMAIDSVGNLYVWGNNAEGQLGISGVQFLNSPQLHGLNNIKQVDGGISHSIALTNSDVLYSWGNNINGQLGNGNFTNSISPIIVSNLDAVKSIYTNFNHNIVIKNDNSIWSWGSNSSGQLGNGNNIVQSTPVYISSLIGTTDIGIGENHSTFLAGFSNSCPSNTISIVVNSSPDVLITYNNGILSVSPLGTAFQWYIDGILIPGANASTFTPNTPGYYTCEVTFSGGCTSLSNEYPYKIVGIGENKKLNLNIYPNPNNGIFTISGNFGLFENCEMLIVNTFGQVVYSQSLNPNQTASQINLSSLPSGIYIVKINSDRHNIVNYKFVILNN